MPSAQIKQNKLEEVEKAIRQLIKFYDKGEANLTLPRVYGASGTASEKEQLAKARALANPFTGYTRAELDRLLAACRASHFAITRGHLIKLLTVPKGPKRQKLEDETLAERWSTLQLGLALRARFGNRRPRAGRMRIMTDWNDAKALIQKFAQQWQRMHAAVTARCEQASSKGRPDTFTANVSPAMKKKLQAIEKALEELTATLGEPSIRPNRSVSKPR